MLARQVVAQASSPYAQQYTTALGSSPILILRILLLLLAAAGSTQLAPPPTVPVLQDEGFQQPGIVSCEDDHEVGM